MKAEKVPTIVVENINDNRLCSGSTAVRYLSCTVISFRELLKPRFKKSWKYSLPTSFTDAWREVWLKRSGIDISNHILSSPMTSVTCVSHRTPHRLWEWEVWTLWSLVRLKSLKDKEEVSSASKRDSSDNPIVVSGQPSHPPLIWCLYRVWQVSVPHKYLFISRILPKCISLNTDIFDLLVLTH